MKVNIGQVVKTFWNTIGKSSASKMINKKISDYIHSICRKYNMREDHESQIIKSVSELVLYVSNRKLNKEKLDKQLVLQQIKGPIAKSLLAGASSVNNSDNFISELVSKIDETDVSNVESFFLGIGMSDTSMYISTLKDVLIQIKDAKSTNSSSFKQLEEDIPYAEVISDEKEHSVRRNKAGNVYDGMSEEEENDFINSLSGRFVGQKLETPADAINMVNNFVEASRDVAKFTELQKTKRAEIRAQAETRIKEIDSMRNLIMAYLDKTFDERSKIFAKQFECVDKALAEGDVNLLAVSLNSITDLAKSSPFKALTDIKNVQKQLSDTNSTFDI